MQNLMAVSARWKRLPVSSEELNLDLTLGSGQAFLWRRDPMGCWTGPIGNKLFCLQRSSSHELSYWSHPASSDPACDKAILLDYFRLDYSLHSLYRSWSKDQNFSHKSIGYHGIRLLSQHPLEALVAFISSSNNNIQRIQSMMIKLCQAYGEPLGCHGDQDYYSFPTLSVLCGGGVEQCLRDLGFGYRAKYVHQTALKLFKDLGGVHWLEELKKQPYQDARQLLQQLPGVGGKVADCVCLMGLGHMQAVPVDVHVWRLAVRDYSSGLPPTIATIKSLSSSNYKIIGDYFRSLFGEMAGWAQAILFAAEIGHEGKFSKGMLQSKPSSPPIAKKRKLNQP